jgi:hypothetical protein
VEISGLLGVAPGVTAVIGGGGKTTLLRTLGEELAHGGAAVVLCATAKFYPFAGLPNLQDPSAPELAAALKKDRLVCAGREVPDTGGKLTAPGLPMEAAGGAGGLCAGGGGRLRPRRPLKAHAPHEPVIPPEAGRVCAWRAVRAWAGPSRRPPTGRSAMRPWRGRRQDETVTPEMAARVLRAERRLGDLYYAQSGGYGPEQLARPGALAALLDAPAAVRVAAKRGYER